MTAADPYEYKETAVNKTYQKGGFESEDLGSSGTLTVTARVDCLRKRCLRRRDAELDTDEPRPNTRLLGAADDELGVTQSTPEADVVVDDGAR